MRNAAAVLVLFAALVVAGLAQQANPSGSWEAVFTGPVGPRPKMFDKIQITLTTRGSTLTGVARAGAWPGEAPITEGRVDGSRVSFTAIGKHLSSSGYPKMVFEGTLQGETMLLTMSWGFVGSETSTDLPMKATRQSR